jgi:hypothetical protein
LVVAPPVTVYVTPPDALLADCPPLYTGPENTLRQTLRAKDQAELSSKTCTADKRALRKWKQESIPANVP